MLKKGQVIIGFEDLKNLMLLRFNPVLVDIISFVGKAYGIEIVKTFRKKQYMGDLHSDLPVREVDFITEANPDLVLQEINKRWKDKNPVAEFRDGVFHIKASPQTKFQGVL